MKKLELSQMENLEGGRRFWGWELTGGFCNGTNYVYTSTYYVVGVGVNTKEEVSNEPCTNDSFW